MSKDEFRFGEPHDEMMVLAKMLSEHCKPFIDDNIKFGVICWYQDDRGCSSGCTVSADDIHEFVSVMVSTIKSIINTSEEIEVK